MEAQTSAGHMSYITLQIPSAFSVGLLQPLLTKRISFFTTYPILQLLHVY